MSRRTEAKKARRAKRRAVRDARWIPDDTLDRPADTSIELDEFDELLTQRGWSFDDELSDDDHAIWFYPPSGTEVRGEGVQPVTTMWVSAADNGEVVYLLLVGSAAGHTFTPEWLLECLDVIEGYRAGDPLPEFDQEPGQDSG